MSDYVNPFDEVREAVSRAEAQLRAADQSATEMARLLTGRLRHVQGWQGKRALAALKRELRDFNIQTERWKE